MGQVTTMGQIESQNTIMGLQQRSVDLEVGRRAWQRLHIDWNRGIKQYQKKCTRMYITTRLHTSIPRDEK